MKRKVQFSVMFILGALFAGTAIAQVLPPEGKTYALVVGISRYQNTAIPRLNYADKDASLFAEWLQSKAGGSVPGYQVKLFTNEAASIANIYAALDWLKLQAAANDKIFFYFSGHGDIETNDTISKGYLLAWNSPATNYRNNAISVADLNENANGLTTINKAKVIIITDACHSGKMAGDFYKGRALTAENLRLVLNNQVRLASCEAGEEAAEGPAWGGGRGVFSFHLLRGLQGMAASESKNLITVSGLDTFMKTAFRGDAALAMEKHIQHPVIDGNAMFPLAMVHPPTLDSLNSGNINLAQPVAGMPAGLQSLKVLGRQPIDYFFSIAQTAELDTILNFQNYVNVPAAEVPLKIVGDFVRWFRTERLLYDSLRRQGQAISRTIDSIYRHTIRKDSLRWAFAVKTARDLSRDLESNSALQNKIETRTGDKDSLALESLLTQLSTNTYLVARFNEKLVTLTHAKTQDMINAYLKGDLAELERRQYYYSGSRQYRQFLHVLDVAIHVSAEQGYLHRILETNRAYLEGLVNRLEIVTATKIDDLLHTAFSQQRLAIKLEPYAAHIHNEMGNLLLQRKQYDSALYHFDYALLLSPAWAVPWSNKIRLNMALGDLSKAKEAIRMAESLQPNLAYVNVNSGLVMEKDSNWLAAEAYYLNAIAQNNVHYLPFERLGLLYINMGKYRLADSFLLEAKSRRDLFAINEFAFRFGIELGGAPEGRAGERTRPDCSLFEDAKITAWKPMILLAAALNDLEKPGKEIGKAERLLQAPEISPHHVPLLHHYLGRKYFQVKNWAKAELYLKEALRVYTAPLALKHVISTQLAAGVQHPPNTRLTQIDPALDRAADEIQPGILSRIDTACLFYTIMYYSYDELEDYYLLANVYEHQQRFDEALSLYSKISEKENQRLMAQALFEDYKKLPVESAEAVMESEAQVSEYETPVRMGATLKAARLLEKLDRFEAAEKVLLNQVQLNRKAGYARQSEMNKDNFGPAGKNPFNHFWLKANYDLEAETYNFYSRMHSRFPRDSEWFRKGGIFLYERLLLTYGRIPVAEQKEFYEFSKRYSYPYKGGESGPTEGIDEDGKYFAEGNTFPLPGTEEAIDITMKAYDPLLSTLSWLKQAEKFSGNVSSDAAIKEAMATLDKWMGNIPEAIQGYQAVLKLRPGSNRTRKDLLELLEANHFLPAAATELDILRTRDTLSREETLRLAYYKLMSKQSEEGLRLLEAYAPSDTKEKNLAMALQIQQLLLTGQPKKAMGLYKKILPATETPQHEMSGEDAREIVDFDNTFYTQARLKAMTNNQKLALRMIKSLLDDGFSYHQVLLNDPAFVNLRKTTKWNKLMGNYSVGNLVSEDNHPQERISYNAIEYRIPGTPD